MQCDPRHSSFQDKDLIFTELQLLKATQHVLHFNLVIHMCFKSVCLASGCGKRAEAYADVCVGAGNQERWGMREVGTWWLWKWPLNLFWSLPHLSTEFEFLTEKLESFVRPCIYSTQCHVVSPLPEYNRQAAMWYTVGYFTIFVCPTNLLFFLLFMPKK